jgi:anti-anti-sigma regulatory factor
MGREVAAQGFKVELSDRSLIGWCARHGQPRLVAGADADAAHTVHPLFPETRSELVLPLRIGERVAGVLDVQSRKEDAFDPDYQQALQTVADQLAVAVENARGMEAMRRLNAHLEEAMRAQERLLETVRALSTPVMPLLEGVVLLPVVGHVDSQRAQQIMDGLLGGVEHYHAQIAIVDITGVALVDTAVANSLVQAAQAVNLLGAEVVLVGMRPEVAQTVVGLGVDLTRLVTMSDLQSGIQYALRRRRGR